MFQDGTHVRPHSGMRQTLWLAVGILLGVGWLATGCVRSSSAATEIRFEWRAGEGFRGQVSIHEARPGQPQGETRMYREGQAPQFEPELPGGVLHSEVGAVVKLLVVVHNPTDEPLRFWTAPHLPLPYSADRGLVMHCLCTGQQYEIPPHGTWTRVIEAGLNPQAGTRGPVAITHVMVAGEVPAP
jgi:hypothetical protein